MPNNKLCITTLLAAVKKGEIEAVRNSIEQYGLPKNGPKTTSYHVLKAAVAKKQKEICKLLINAGSSLNHDSENRQGESILNLAVAQKESDIVKMILEKEVELSKSNEYKALSLAVKNQDVDTLKILLEHKFDVNYKDPASRTILQIVFDEIYFLKRHCDSTAILNTIRLLLSYEASINVTEVNGLNFSDFAMKQMIQSHIDDEAKMEILKIFLLKGAISSSFDEIGILKRLCCNIKFLKLFIEHGKNINMRFSRNGNTILHYMMIECHERDEGFLEALHMLLTKCKVMINVPNDKGQTSLHFAIKFKLCKTCEVLLSNGADVNLRDEDGNTVLHYLAQSLLSTSKVDQNLIKTILTYSEFLNTRNSKGQTPLIVASKCSNAYLIKKILEAGSIYFNSNKQLISILSLSSKNNDFEAIKIFLENGIDIDAQDNNGRSCLNFACRDIYSWRHSTKCSQLLKYGADINIMNKRNETPIFSISPSARTRYIPEDLRIQVAKLQAANLFVHDMNIKCVEEFQKNFQISNAPVTASQYEDEIKKLKEFVIGQGISIADLLYINEHKMSRFINNPTLKKMINSRKLKLECPNYCDMIKLKYKKGLIRSFLVQPAETSFKKLIEIPWPLELCDNVLKYLSNETLISIIESAGAKEILK